MIKNEPKPRNYCSSLAYLTGEKEIKKQPLDTDKLIQKFLKGNATGKEKDILLERSLKTINEMMVRLKEIKIEEK